MLPSLHLPNRSTSLTAVPTVQDQLCQFFFASREHVNVLEASCVLQERWWNSALTVWPMHATASPNNCCNFSTETPFAVHFCGESTTITCRKADVMSKAKFAPPPSCLFMTVTLGCDLRRRNCEQVRSRGFYHRTHDALRPHLPTNRDFLQVWELPIADEGQALGTLRSAFWFQSVCPPVLRELVSVAANTAGEHVRELESSGAFSWPKSKSVHVENAHCPRTVTWKCQNVKHTCESERFMGPKSSSATTSMTFGMLVSAH